MSDISPTLSANVASSNGFCMAPLPNAPRSPPFAYDPQSERLAEASANSASVQPERELRMEVISDIAEEGVRVISWFVRREMGLREPVCLHRR